MRTQSDSQAGVVKGQGAEWKGCFYLRLNAVVYRRQGGPAEIQSGPGARESRYPTGERHG
jgi:hypothetical protein